ncbi:integration host factor [Streptomyces sp. SID14478]|uniref:HU family DNA-binding protein n=1 Tax=Streptomyces sp. SID14478 TaxID=2706073 RepID=UPI0013E06C36|nr:HU family DNA-binding protein [Streptomyces sp. SID14478]NEB80851.1 integration host factor [Streptomyces sp. SID14478]
MTRTELVAALAERAEVSQKDADAVLTAFAATVGDIVAKGDEKVTIPGFLTFERTHRAEREGRNPATGETMTIPAGYSVKVSAGSKLKESAQG